jgi:Wiskott-Aldrich syndrome protein
MPSITLNNPEDKATVKRFLSSPNTRIITATVARLYIAYPDPTQWTYAGILGAVALIQTSNTFFLRIVDLLVSTPFKNTATFSFLASLCLAYTF